MKKIRNLAIKIAVLATPLVSFAQPSTSVEAPDIGTPVSTLTFGSLWTRVGVWVNWITAIIGVAALIFLLYGAYMYISAGQNEDNLKKAKASVLYGVIGAVVAVLAFSIFSFARSLVA